MKKNIFDLETLPAPEAKRIELLEAALEVADAECLAIKPPGNIKKAESIAEWLATEAPAKAQAIRDAAAADADLAWRKTGLSAAFGRIYCIGYSTNGSTPVSPTLEDFGATVDDIKAGNMTALFAERAMLLSWFETCAYQKCQEGLPQYIGHNISGFDLRFVFQRVVIIGKQLKDLLGEDAPDAQLALPAGYPIQAKPWESDRLFDTMIAWAGNNGRVKLDVLCEALGIAMKGAELDGEEIDGSMVVDYVYGGQGKKVATYCCGDVTRTWEIYKVLQPALAVV